HFRENVAFTRTWQRPIKKTAFLSAVVGLTLLWWGCDTHSPLAPSAVLRVDRSAVVATSDPIKGTVQVTRGGRSGSDLHHTRTHQSHRRPGALDLRLGQHRRGRYTYVERELERGW